MPEPPAERAPQSDDTVVSTNLPQSLALQPTAAVAVVHDTQPIGLGVSSFTISNSWFWVKKIISNVMVPTFMR